MYLAEIQKLGLSTVHHTNPDLKKLVRSFMTLLFLPEDQIISVFSQLEVRDLPLSEVHKNQYAIFKKYIRRQWIISIPKNELYIFNCQHITNNGAENYHCRLKKDIVVSHPRVWFFVEILNKTIQDTYLDIERLGKGIDITRSRKLKDIQNDSFRAQCKEMLVSGENSPTRYVDAIANSIHPDTNPISLLGDCQDESSSDDEPEDDNQVNCCVYLLQRITTVLFQACTPIYFTVVIQF